MDRPTTRLSQWIYYLAASLYYAAVFLRTVLTYGDSPVLRLLVILLLLGLVLFVTEPAISRRWRGYFPIYLIAQTCLVFVLLFQPGYPDFFAALLAILSTQAMLNLHPKIGAAWLAACAIGMGLLLAGNYGPAQAAAFTLIYTAGNILLGTYALVTRREQAAQDQILGLAGELLSANRQLQDYSAQREHLVVARERNRFARELHDSVTQTVFSMTLTTQSALLVLERDPSRVKDQLARLNQLVGLALSEMQALIAELKPVAGDTQRLLPALQRYLSEPRIAEHLSVALQVEGDGNLAVAEEKALLGIAQEALNNILKHAYTNQARIHLCLEEPVWMEIEDQGCGFDAILAGQHGGVGLSSMRERAQEIGWNLQVRTSPGAGTRIRVEKGPVSEVDIWANRKIKSKS
jgi:signal transduction histidine kinase